MAITKTGVLIDTNSSFPSPRAYEENGRVTSIQVTDLSVGQTYYAKAYVVDNGTTIYSNNVVDFATRVRVVDYLTFTNTANSTNTLQLKESSEHAPIITLQYSTDSGRNWTTWSSSTGDLSVTLPVGGTIKFRGDNTAIGGYYDGNVTYHYFSSTDDIEVSGNIMTLVDSTGEATTMNNYAFSRLFYNMTHLENNGLTIPVTSIRNYGCYGLFENCTSLTNAPAFIHTNIGDYGCCRMYKNCVNLAACPDMSTMGLDRSSVSAWGFASMYEDCSSITATAYAGDNYMRSRYGSQGVFSGMYKNCTSLTTISTPFGIDSRASYEMISLFENCTSLVDASDAFYYHPYQYPGPNCFDSAFKGCSSLRVAPTLRWSRVSAYSMSSMFADCVSLEDMPELPATTLANYCYYRMFSNTPALRNVQELPAVYLADYCYAYMFEYSGITESPVIFGSALVDSSLNRMFFDCGNLSQITVYTSTWIERYADEWVVNVNNTGTFFNLSAANIPVGYNGIPNGWSVRTSI